MSYPDKVERAVSLLESHIDEVRKLNPAIDNPIGITSTTFRAGLIKLGATNEAALRECRWEDLADIGVPPLLARSIATVFREVEVLKSTNPGYISERKADSMSYEELFARYTPADENSVSRKLKALSKGEQCVVFNGDAVNAEASAKLLNEIRKGLPGRTLYDGKRVYKVGEVLDEQLDENPLYVGRPLRPDGTCDQLNRSWEGVPLEVRQLLRLAIAKTGELEINNLDVAHNVLDRSIQGGALADLRKRYSAAAALFDEQKDEGTLPRLRVKINRVNGNGPFGKADAHRSY